jgi:hypothetical protein
VIICNGSSLNFFVGIRVRWPTHLRESYCNVVRCEMRHSLIKDCLKKTSREINCQGEVVAVKEVIDVLCGSCTLLEERSLLSIAEESHRNCGFCEETSWLKRLQLWKESPQC